MKLFFVLFFIASVAQTKQEPAIYGFAVESLNGGMINLGDYKGKKMLIVNTASKCGYTPQYESLEKLYKDHKDNLVVIGFPSDNFGGQEFEDNSDIREFCNKNYGVTFPMSVKVDVKGENAHPLFRYLTTKSLNGELDAEIKWNFSKFLIDEQGRLKGFFGSKVLPEEIIK